MTRTLTPDETQALAAARALGDADIDLTDRDAPEVLDWSGARRGLFSGAGNLEPATAPPTVRLDDDVAAWFARLAHGTDFQAEVNRVLRRHVARQSARM